MTAVHRRVLVVLWSALAVSLGLCTVVVAIMASRDTGAPFASPADDEPESD